MATGKTTSLATLLLPAHGHQRHPATAATLLARLAGLTGLAGPKATGLCCLTTAKTALTETALTACLATGKITTLATRKAAAFLLCSTKAALAKPALIATESISLRCSRIGRLLIRGALGPVLVPLIRHD